MLSRHGSRYPTTGANVFALAQKIADSKGKFKALGQLSFLNDWKFELGAEILVPRGRQELFDSGILHYYQYAQLYNPNSKIIARTTTQDRMLKVHPRLSFLKQVINESSPPSTSWQVSSGSSGPKTQQSK